MSSIDLDNVFSRCVWKKNTVGLGTHNSHRSSTLQIAVDTGLNFFLSIKPPSCAHGECYGADSLLGPGKKGGVQLGSNGFATGCEATITCDLSDISSDTIGKMTAWVDNPFQGGNAFHISINNVNISLNSTQYSSRKSTVINGETVYIVAYCGSGDNNYCKVAIGNPRYFGIKSKL